MLLLGIRGFIVVSVRRVHRGLWIGDDDVLD